MFSFNFSRLKLGYKLHVYMGGKINTFKEHNFVMGLI